MAEKTKTLAWSDERTADLAAWIARGQALGVDMTALRPNGAKSQDVSHSAAIGAALRRATACRCGEVCQHRRDPKTCEDCHDVKRREIVDEPSRAHLPEPEARLPKIANPLGAIRRRAGLTQKQAGAMVGISRGAWANAEKAATATLEMVTRARKAIGGGR